MQYAQYSGVMHSTQVLCTVLRCYAQYSGVRWGSILNDIGQLTQLCVVQAMDVYSACACVCVRRGLCVCVCVVQAVDIYNVCVQVGVCLCGC
jgi:hypothetical protein